MMTVTGVMRVNWDRLGCHLGISQGFSIKQYPSTRPVQAASPWLNGWCADDHPLTARVAVNRYWQMLFGQGLVSTPDDFGSQGAYPTHPELLDWLAIEFRDSGWNIKHLLKTIVMSSTYRQSSTASREAYGQDPQNRWLARAPRLSSFGRVSARWHARYLGSVESASGRPQCLSEPATWFVA